MRRSSRKHPIGFVLSGIAFIACGPRPATERVFDGRTVSGPYIEPSTYAAYADAAYLEARGEWKAAEDAYRRALQQDPDSPGIWTRLGVIRCRSDLASALEAFQRATEQSSYGAVWAARARCLHDHRRSAEALAAAQSAIASDPTNAEANLLIAELYREQARPASSRAWLFAWLLLDPTALSHWKALAKQAEALADRALSQLIRSELARRAAQGSELATAALSALRPPRLVPGAPPELETAVVQGDLASARAAAREAGVSDLRLAQLALDLGAPSVAARQAELLLGADPHNADAWIVALTAAALAPDEDAFRRLLTADGSARLPTTEVAERMKVLLSWWVGEAAASEWAEAHRAQTAAGR